MSNDKQELIDYRISRSKETYEEALLLATKDHWNAVANRLYYSCYYIVNALLIKDDLDYSSHNGVKTEFHKSYVKTSLVSMDSGKIYSRLFNLRQEGDYIDFKRFERNDIEPFIADVDKFLSEIESVIKK
jgi:uncharacterized protein (UPF0332 family)